MADIKMKDIAAEVGVSVVTVSNALSGKKGVSEDVRKLVEQTAREMGYDNKKHNKNNINSSSIKSSYKKTPL